MNKGIAQEPHSFDRLVTHSNCTVKKICAPGLKSYIAVGETSLSTPVSTELFNTKNNSLRNEELFTSELNTEYKGKYTLQGLQRTAVGPAPPKVGPD